MLDASSAKICFLAVHKVGNKTRGEGTILSKRLHALNEQMEECLLNYFFKPFTSPETFRFSHSSNVKFNEVHDYSQEVFADRNKFLSGSIAAAKHLYDCSEHPKIKSGEVYFAFIENVKFDGKTFESIGIFKSETKDRFIKVQDSDASALLIEIEKGANLKSLDKGSLILNLQAKDGYRVLSVDNSTDETQFWRNKFLNIESVHDGHFHTTECLNMCQKFCDDVYSKESDKTEQIGFLKKSVDYFSSNETFNFDDFSKQVLSDGWAIDKFKSYKNDYEKTLDRSDLSSFPISKPTLKKLKRKFKDLIRLDTNIEVKLKFADQNKAGDFIEKGFDSKKNMRFYKFYFHKEF